jgi:hypothetical protein
MLTGDALWLDEESPLDEPADLLAIPEIKQHVAHEHHDDDLGLRALLERPEALTRPRGHRRNRRRRRASAHGVGRQSAMLRAA